MVPNVFIVHISFELVKVSPFVYFTFSERKYKILVGTFTQQIAIFPDFWKAKRTSQNSRLLPIKFYCVFFVLLSANYHANFMVTEDKARKTK